VRPNALLKARVDRLLAGDTDLNDLTQVVFNLRSRSFGNELIREVGDFIAHRETRERGPVKDFALNFFIYFAFGLPKTVGGPRVDPPYPRDFSRGLLAHLEILNDDEIFDGTGFRKKTARAHLKSFVDRLSPRKDGRLDVVKAATANEDCVLQFLASHVVLRPFFDDEQLFSAFVDVLEKNALVEPHELESCGKLKQPLALLVVELMHHCVVSSGGVISNLMAGTREGSIGVWATSHMPGTETSIGAVFEVFSTKLLAADWCAGSLANHNGMFPGAIELRSDRKLHPVAGDPPPGAGTVLKIVKPVME
jgi:hypothetical protein